MRYFLLPACVLMAALTFALYTAPHGALTATAPAAAAVIGAGFWEAVSCIACVAAFLMGGGLTIAGLAVFLAANPEIAVICVANCSAAASAAAK